MKIEGINAPPRRGKDWSWSYSKLKNFESCPKKMYEVDILKTYSDNDDDPNGALAWGNRVHKALADAVTGKVPLPPEMSQYAEWVDRVQRGTGQLFVEQKFAINRMFQKTEYFAPDAWYRGIGDVVRVQGDLALVLDWKTGKVLEDSVQLMLMAQCLFSHYPELKYVRSEFVWLKEGCTTPELFTRQEVADQWIGLLDRVNGMEEAHKALNYPPKPSGLCKKHCPVTSCPFHGKGAR